MLSGAISVDNSWRHSTSTPLRLEMSYWFRTTITRDFAKRPGPSWIFAARHTRAVVVELRSLVSLLPPLLPPLGLPLEAVAAATDDGVAVASSLSTTAHL